MAGRVIQVAKAPQKPVTRKDLRRLRATLCFYYPQYTLATARLLPHRDVILLIKTAQRENAIKFYNMTQIAAAPHTKGGKGVKRLTEQFKKLMEK